MPTLGGGVSVGNLTAFLGLNDRDFTRGIARAIGSLNSVQGVMRGVGSAMTTFITVPLLAIGGAAVNSSMKFEKAFSEIQGLVGVAKDQVSAFKKEILTMAPATSRPPQELAEALRFVTSSGFKGAEALDIVKQSAMAAAAGLGQTQVVSDVLTSAINAYGKENLSAAQATDTLVAAVREGKAEPNELATGLGYVIPIASQMGVSFQEASAAIAAMTRQGISASTAATNLRQMLSDLLDPSERARKALQGMGTSAEEMRKVVAEKGLLAALGFLKEQMATNEEAFASVFPNVRALTGALALTGKNAEDVRMVFNDLTDNTGDMQQAFDIAAQSSAFKFNQAMADLKVAGIQLGNALMPIFLDMVNAVKSLANWFTSLSDSSKKLVVSIGAVAAVAGPLLLVLGSMVAVFSAISLQVVAIVAAIVALGAAFIYLSQNWDAVKERISDWNWWRNMLIDMLQFIIQYNPFNALVDSIIDVMNWLIKLNPALKGFEIPDFTKNMIDGLEELKGQTKEYEHQFGSFKDAVVSMAKKAGDALRGIFPTGSGGGSTATSGASSIQKETPMDTTFKPKGVTWFGGEGDGPIRKITDAVLELDRAFKSMITNTLADFGETIGELFSGDASLHSFVDGLINTIADFGKSFGKMLIAAGVAAMAFDQLLLNPAGAIAAGVALVAISSGIKNLLNQGASGGGSDKGTALGNSGRRGGVQGLAVGGFVTSGGVFQLHKDEMVSLPRGSAVTPAHMANGGGVVEVVGEISGYTISLNQKKEGYRRGRLG